MAWQLIFTSAPRGLVAGRSGFCTVARHAEIRDRLVAEIERLSAFDRPAGQTAPRIASHRVLDISGARYYLLSRIQDAGLDYSGRPVHIAHHIVADETEILRAVSPAQILRCFPWRATWNEPPRFLNDTDLVDLAAIGAPLPPGERQLPTGCWLLRPPGGEEELLACFDESLRPLDPPRRWQVRFTTSFQPADNTADFDWRGCADAPANTRGEPVFDLRQPASLPQTATPARDLALAERETPPPSIRVEREQVPDSVRVERDEPVLAAPPAIPLIPAIRDDTPAGTDDVFDDETIDQTRRTKTVVITVIIALLAFLLFLAVVAIRML